MPEAGKLGKNEPHPVTLLLNVALFRKDERVDRRSRINKAVEGERIGRGGGLTPGWLSESWHAGSDGRHRQGVRCGIAANRGS